MSYRFVGAIVLAVLVLFIFFFLRAAYYRWRIQQRPPRRRDLVPRHLQARAKIKAALRRILRGQRFPTEQAQREHAQFVKALKRHQRAQGHQRFLKLRARVSATAALQRALAGHHA